MLGRKIGLLVVLLCCFSLASFGQKGRLPAIKMDKLVEKYKNAGGVMVVNFWSTWCKPCIEEIPHFIEVTNTMSADSVQLLLVSQDTRSLYESGKLDQYLSKKNWKQVPVVWLNETNADYYCPLVDSTWSGVIPATVIIHPAKKYYRFFEESLSADELKAEIKKAIRGEG